ncbi:transcriptional regulator [Mycolicibacterium sp. ND9-15]|uniref:transcriptional regulator n=1 Tax=Mycolicibacterium sp. ND9-15 TaxID=3042320 RepID=UPI002DDB6BE4|nr:transcriptional regulator [Mycolicibacterium sp. ND9-15]WSE58505.1 transcriptional regulator [Mycolicibacterium sp. ND9-15]
MTNPESADRSTEASDPGVVRAGAAAAARRRELNISQRGLAADGIINAGALIAFEKGRSWPRERTRAKLEEVLRWPPGAIARIRQGEPVASPEDQPSAGLREDEVPLIAQAVITAVSTFDSAIAALPAPDDPEFGPKVAKVLADLRQLEGVAARAARISRVTPPLIKALSAVRTRYADLMLRAARSPDPTLGQRLYAARRGANLTISETAQAAGVSDDDIVHTEAEQPVSAAATEAIEALITELA